MCASLRLCCSRKRAPSIPLGLSTAASSALPLLLPILQSRYWPSGLGWPSQEEAGLSWPQSSSEAGSSGICFLSLPGLLLLETHPKLAQAPHPPIHPPHSRSQKLRSQAPLGWGGVVITWQWGRRQGPGGCCLRDWVIWELNSARTGSRARPEPVDRSSYGLGDLGGSLQFLGILLWGPAGRE